MHIRNNSRMANIVEQGIIIDTLSGAVDAWTFLSGHAVPEHIIMRVLLHPAKRRPSDSAFTATFANVASNTEGHREPA
jgi:hypothetical protein